MTSLDLLNLDDFQDLSADEENTLAQIIPKTTSQVASTRNPSSSSGIWDWTPLLIAIVVTFLAYLINTDWVQSKLQDIPYYKYSLLGLLFAVTIILILFLR